MKLPGKLTAVFAAVLLCFLFAVSAAAAGTDAPGEPGEDVSQEAPDSGTEDPTDPEGEAPTKPGEEDPVETPEYCMGDADADGEVSAADARLILRAVISLEELRPECAVYADLDGDGILGTLDARLTLRTSIGLESAVRHAFGEISVTVPATCECTGSVTFSCADCGNTGELVLPRLPHTFVQNVITPAGCTTEGEAERVCSRCGYKTTVSVPPAGHEWVSAGKGKPKKCAVCGISAEGWAKIDGKYHYYDANGEFVKNAIVDGDYVDDTGCRCEDAVIRQAVSFVLKHGGEGSASKKLRRCYDYIISTYGYKTIHGFPSAETLPGTASDMFGGSYGNCYSFAAMLAYIGKVLGYPARIDSGKILNSNGQMAPHGWTELSVSGKWYMFDAVREKYYYIDGFMRTHDNFQAVHEHGTYFTLYTENGTAYWK